MMKLSLSKILIVLFVFTGTLFAESPPKFYSETFPEHALESMLTADKILMGKQAKLDAITRELVALGVAAQIPCTYCIYFHSKKARSLGASDAQLREAVATAAHVRHWSTVLNGMAYDLEAFKTEIDLLLKKK